MNDPPKGERLQVVLARFGISSRRGVVSLIESGKVTVNGKVILEKGFRVNASTDKITLDGKDISIETPPEKRYFIFNKPKGVLTTLQDPHAEHCVADFFKDVSARVFPVGRLDRDTTGLLIMTNDGALAFRLTHPRFGVKKKYRARIKGAVTDEKIKRLQEGIDLEEGRTAPCVIEIETKTSRETVLYVTLHEGKKRQIRRLFEKVGHEVLELERLSYGPLSLGDLRFGQKRELKPFEVKQLEQATEIRKSLRGTSS
ncbi:MAG: hypothetical protein AUJ71_00570 [Candidatus Omnitrophica bacterium CG1_02_49_16]|nr:MAG: hypothetical protein AUJ71_00570 [Candidatus Omnitrophica bacterium CG1_02_49_16]